MALNGDNDIAGVIAGHESELLAEWLRLLRQGGSEDRIGQRELEAQGRDVLRALRDAAASAGTSDIHNSGYDRLRAILEDMSRSRALHGFSSSETATFVLSLKEPLFARVRDLSAGDPDRLADLTWRVSRLVDKLGLYTIEVFQRSREAVIIRQQQEISELSTPVVKLWQGILALPLIGTLDSQRTQTVLENLLQSIVDHGAEIAIIDITGVPTVDTLVAQHLLKTVAAARLMGADCIVSGIRPQIAQTMVHLGVELNVVSKASLADAFALALRRVGRTVIRAGAQVPAEFPRGADAA